ncbi:hypothetical protein HK405_007354, partial [Cladochytrium tenue]
VEEFAMEKWGGPEKLDEEFYRREQDRKDRKDKKYRKKMQASKEDTNEHLVA